MTSIPRPLVLLIALLLALLAFGDLGYRKLADPDEGRYSEISREMAASNDFITPRLNGLKYFEKPPLQYWATAAVFKLFGENEFTARLYTLLCGLGCIFLIGYTATRLYDADTGAYAALALISSWYFMAFTQVVTLDTGLTFWMTLGICGFLLAHGLALDSSRQRWMLVAWAGMAGAVLSKGLIGIVFPSAAIFLYCLTQQNWRLLAKLEWFYGLGLFFIITVPWHVMVSLQNPEFAHFYFVHEHFERFLTTVHRREAPWWTFFAITVVGLMPWGLALIPAINHGWRNPALRLSKPDGSTFAPLKFVLLFSAFVLLFFTKSSSKLPGYILPIFPLLAFVIGVYLKNAEPKKLAWWLIPMLPLTLGGAYAAWLEPTRRVADGLMRQQMYSEFSLWVIAGLLTLATATLLAFTLLRKSRTGPAVATMAAATMILVVLLSHGYDRLSPLKSSFAVSQAISERLKPETRLYAVKIYDQSLPFYLKRTLTLVEYVDEFEMGQNAEPGKHIAAIKDFPAAWSMPGPAIAIIQPSSVDELKALGINFEIIYRDARRLAVQKN